MPIHPVSMIVSLFFVINALGNIPLYIALLGRYSPHRQRMIILREFGIALFILLLFNFFGSSIFNILGINQHILGMAGGILLLLISLTMIFPSREPGKEPQQEPMIVPLATPIIAGPGSITYVMLSASRVENSLLMTGIIIAAIVISATIGVLSSFIKKGLGEKGLLALERLGGMILCLIAVQMFASGTIELVKFSFGI